MSKQVMQSTWVFDTDSSIQKSFNLPGRVKLKMEGDFFNVFNNPGKGFASSDPSGIVLTNVSENSPRQVQISARLTF
jgi:ribosomal 30S subunit maturation factor RimM